MKMADYSGWVQAGVASLVAATGTVFWAASNTSNLHNTQAQVQQLQAAQQADHDKVVSQNQKLDDIAADVSDIKKDVRAIAQHVH